jgi:hypothetical protein
MQEAHTKYVNSRHVEAYFEEESSSNSSLDSIENDIVSRQLEKEMIKRKTQAGDKK